jgi:hypothetical protein
MNRRRAEKASNRWPFCFSRLRTPAISPELVAARHEFLNESPMRFAGSFVLPGPAARLNVRPVSDCAPNVSKKEL